MNGAINGMIHTSNITVTRASKRVVCGIDVGLNEEEEFDEGDDEYDEEVEEISSDEFEEFVEEEEEAEGGVGFISSAIAAAKRVLDSLNEEQEQEQEQELGDSYTATMQMAMGNASLIYRHEMGMNYARVLPDLIVGSCLQTPQDLDILRDEERVGTVLCLQQDSDMDYFDLDILPIQERALARGDIRHVRSEIRDFDPFDLRMCLPAAVALLHKGILETGSGYVHCTAGLGRAPAVALAYMTWLRGYQLEEANEVLQAVRPCGPKLFAIRAAAADIITGCPTLPVTFTWRGRGVIETVEIAGLDIGWHNKMNLERTPGGNSWTVTRDLPIGTYFYKFIVNGRWTLSPDNQVSLPDQDGNVNNMKEVISSFLTPDQQALRARIMADGSHLTPEDREILVEKLTMLSEEL